MPSEAARELRRQPVGWVEEVIEARHYARAKQVYDKAEDKRAVVKGDALMQLVEELDYDHAKALILRRRARLEREHRG